MRNPGHRHTPIFSLLPVDRALVSVSVSSKCAERHSDGAAQVAKHHEFLTEDLDSMGQVLQFVREANRLPIAVQIFAARCAGTDMGEFYVFLGRLAMEVSTVSCGQNKKAWWS